MDSQIYGWKAVTLEESSSQDALRVTMAPEVGGRVVSLCIGGEQLLFALEEAKGQVVDVRAVSDLAGFKRGRDFPITGGDKTWLAPQDRWIEGKPPVDVDSGAYEVMSRDARSIALRSPLCRETGMRITREITLLGGGRLRLRERARNESPSTRQWSPWNVTQILRPFQVYASMPAAALRPYDFSTSRELYPHRVSATGAWTRIDVTTAGEFKFGGEAAAYRQGEALVLAVRETSRGVLAWGRSFAVQPGARYAHDSSFEIYNFPTDRNPYFELEAHPPIRELQPGEENVLEQLWVIAELPASSGIRANDPDAIARALGW